MSRRFIATRAEGRKHADVGLPHPQLNLFVEQRQHRQWIGHASVDADQGDGPAAAHDVDC